VDSSTILAVGCFVTGLIQAFGTVVQLLDRHAARMNASDATNLKSKFPWLAMGLLLGAIFTIALGFWLILRRPPTPQATAITATSHTNQTPTSTSVPPQKTAPTALPNAEPSSHKAQSASQSGHHNQQVTIGGNVTQGGDGGCQQNIIGGNGNTNQCAPEMPKISAANETKLTNDLGKIKPKLQGAVSVYYDFTADGGTELAQQIQGAFAGTDVQAVLETPVLNFIVNGPSYPGLSLANVNEENKPIADALDKLLKKNKIISVPLKRISQDSVRARGDNSLFVIIRKP